MDFKRWGKRPFYNVKLLLSDAAKSANWVRRYETRPFSDLWPLGLESRGF